MKMPPTKCPYCSEGIEDDDEYNGHMVLMHPAKIDDEVGGFYNERQMFYEELIKYTKSIMDKQDVIGSVNLRIFQKILINMKPHFLKYSLKPLLSQPSKEGIIIADKQNPQEKVSQDGEWQDTK